MLKFFSGLFASPDIGNSSADSAKVRLLSDQRRAILSEEMKQHVIKTVFLALENVQLSDGFVFFGADVETIQENGIPLVRMTIDMEMRPNTSKHNDTKEKTQEGGKAGKQNGGKSCKQNQNIQKGCIDFLRG